MPKSVEAANNAAVAEVYCKQLEQAVTSLEEQLRAQPQASMHPTVVANLANLYQMTPSASGGKATLERLVTATAPDDFDMSVLQSPAQ